MRGACVIEYGAKLSIFSAIIFFNYLIDGVFMFLPIFTVFAIVFGTGISMQCDVKGVTPNECISFSESNLKVVHEYPNSNR